MDNSYSESGLVRCFASVLKYSEHTNIVDTKQLTGIESVNDQKNEYIDLVWDLPNERRLFKFKRIRLNGLIATQPLFENIVPKDLKESDWSRKTYQTVFKLLAKLTEDELLQLEVNPKITKIDNILSVSKMFIKGKFQLFDSMNNEKKSQFKQPIVGYIVLGVANRYIIRKYTFNEKNEII